MSKAILVLDEMPKSCNDCPLWESHEEWEQYIGRCAVKGGCRRRTIGRPFWCPLKEMPELKFDGNFDWADLAQTKNVAINQAINHGWNKCLKEIGG